jgi:Sulfotransferase family
MPGAGPLPNVFVVGDAKCGTTSLHRIFELTPGIGTARTRKELHWFSAPELVAATAGPGDDTIPSAIVHTENEYRAEFAHLPPDLRVVADVSPSYLRNPEAARRLHAFAPEARIVILLREPAAKVFSQYVHLWTEGRDTLPFEEAFARSAERRAAGFSDMFDYEAGGFYAAHVARYLDLFGPDRVLVMLFEEMIRDMAPVRGRLEAFLDVPLPATELPQTNAGGRAKSPLIAAVLGNARLKGAVRAALPLALRTRLSARVRGAVTFEKPELASETRASLPGRYASDVAELGPCSAGRPVGPRPDYRSARGTSGAIPEPAALPRGRIGEFGEHSP